MFLSIIFLYVRICTYSIFIGFKTLTNFSISLTFWYSFLPYLCSVQNEIVIYKKAQKVLR